MERTPVEWISIGAGTIIVGLCVLVGLAFIAIGIYGELILGVNLWRGIIIGLAVIALPFGLYRFGKLAGRGWDKLRRPRL